MRRTAGSVGCGGGPARVELLFSPPAGLLEPQVLQEGEGDHRHQGMAVQPRPGATLEVVEAKLLLQLLVGLLTDPSSASRSIRLHRSAGPRPGEGVP